MFFHSVSPHVNEWNANNALYDAMGVTLDARRRNCQRCPKFNPKSPKFAHKMCKDGEVVATFRKARGGKVVMQMRIQRFDPASA